MTSDILEGKWKQIKGAVKQRWGELTDDELDQIEGKSEQLIGLLQEKYGYDKLKAQRELDEFIAENR